MCHSAQVWVRKQLSGVCSLFPPVESALQLAHDPLCGLVSISHLPIITAAIITDVHRISDFKKKETTTTTWIPGIVLVFLPRSRC